MEKLMIEGVAPATYATALGTVFLGLNVEQWGILAMVVGIVMTLVTYATNTYLKTRDK